MILDSPNVGIVFTCGAQHRQSVIGRTGGNDLTSCPGCISSSISVRCRMLTLGRDVG